MKEIEIIKETNVKNNKTLISQMKKYYTYSRKRGIILTDISVKMAKICKKSEKVTCIKQKG